MENLTDLFSLSADDFKEDKKNKRERYRPDAKKGINNRYEAVIRLLPWYKDPKNSIQSKWTSWLVDPDTDNGKYVDCPSSIGEKSILQDIYFKLKDSDDVREQKLKDHFSRRPQYASLVQILEDKNNPDDVGRIMVLVYGTKLHKKFMAEMQPKHGTPRVPFDVFEGRPFQLDVSLVSGFNNYDECQFIDATGFDAKLPDGTVLTEKTQENLQKLLDWLKAESPDLDKYGFRAWDDETREFVMSVIRNTIPNGSILESIEKTNKRLGGTAKVQSGDTLTNTSLASAPKAEAPKAEAPKAEAPKVEAPKVEAPKVEAPQQELPNTPDNDFGSEDFGDVKFDEQLYEGL